MNKLLLVLLALTMVSCEKYYLGLHLSSLDHVPKRSYKNFGRLVSVPESFDSRNQWPSCVHAIRNQA